MKELLELDAIERTSMACPALPLCGLAIGEAERTLPDCNRRIRALLDRLQFPHDFPLVVRAPPDVPTESWQHRSSGSRDVAASVARWRSAASSVCHSCCHTCLCMDSSQTRVAMLGAAGDTAYVHAESSNLLLHRALPARTVRPTGDRCHVLLVAGAHDGLPQRLRAAVHGGAGPGGGRRQQLPDLAGRLPGADAARGDVCRPRQDAGEPLLLTFSSLLSCLSIACCAQHPELLLQRSAAAGAAANWKPSGY